MILNKIWKVFCFLLFDILYLSTLWGQMVLSNLSLWVPTNPVFQFHSHELTVHTSYSESLPAHLFDLETFTPTITTNACKYHSQVTYVYKISSFKLYRYEELSLLICLFSQSNILGFFYKMFPYFVFFTKAQRKRIMKLQDIMRKMS